MRNESVVSPRTLDWAVAARPAPGEDVCGDLHLVSPASDGVLLAVIEGQPLFRYNLPGSEPKPAPPPERKE